MNPGDPIDKQARDRFAEEWQSNFAVCANAGSGKTTAISKRLASLALSVAARSSANPEAVQVLSRTAVVTYTKKAARQIGQRARSELAKALASHPSANLNTLELLDRAFFGTIHAFCLNLARRHGHSLGAHLNPEVIEDHDTRVWEEFLEKDSLLFPGIPETVIDAFLRHRPFDSLFPLAQRLSRSQAEGLRRRLPASLRPSPDLAALADIDAIKARANTAQKVAQNQRTAHTWVAKLANETGFIGFPEPDGTAGGVDELFARLVAPVKSWVADVGGALAAELADRYRTFRRERGVQTYSDQTELALAVLGNPVVLDRIREEGWRIILDEAQDTDPAQFSILVEITRPLGATPGAWPDRTPGAPGPRAGHFSMVGDGQQAIYGSRADVSNFLRYVEAYRRRDGGEVLEFSVTFRSPKRLIDFMNAGMPSAFDGGREHNFGAGGVRLQVPYQPLAEKPDALEGGVYRLPLSPLPVQKPKVDEAMRAEATQVADRLLALGPSGLGVRSWGQVCLIAPRNDWIKVVAEVFQARGQKIALQVRKTSNATNPVHAWLTGLFAVICAPEDPYEWAGVLREVFAVSDAEIARRFRSLDAVAWDDATAHGPAIGAVLERLSPFILTADDEGVVLGNYLRRLAEVASLPQRAATLDPSGGLTAELERLLGEASARGVDGLSPRQWFDHLLKEREKGRPSGNPEPDAINLITAHSSKGLEWPVVVPLGLWRPLGLAREHGFRLVEERGSGVRVYFDSGSVPDDMAERHRAETWRENTRLMYVTFTRPEQRLILPWASGFGPALRTNDVSFSSLWGDVSAWESLPVLEAVSPVEETVVHDTRSRGLTRIPSTVPTVVPVPERLLPHQLAHHAVDATRAAEVNREVGSSGTRADPDEAIAYGLWWHETLEFFPWQATASEREAYLARALVQATASGWESRGRSELDAWSRSAALTALGDARWRRQAELNVFSPLRDGAWIDGVMDLVLADPVAREVWVVDWKTNRRRLAEEDQAFGARVLAEYTPQLQAYGTALTALYPGWGLRLWLYPTALGALVEVPFVFP